MVSWISTQHLADIIIKNSYTFFKMVYKLERLCSP